MFDSICWKYSGFLNYLCISYVIRIFSQWKLSPIMQIYTHRCKPFKVVFINFWTLLAFQKGTQSQKNFKELLESFIRIGEQVLANNKLSLVFSKDSQLHIESICETSNTIPKDCD